MGRGYMAMPALLTKHFSESILNYSESWNSPLLGALKIDVLNYVVEDPHSKELGWMVNWMLIPADNRSPIVPKEYRNTLDVVFETCIKLASVADHFKIPKLRDLALI
ncbi:Uu.00g117990.m01.CDS01 [Anthostomella pinea]|uniref:Uu.00g117990.m01.CDS01 n=1 Tax=Anthostomella pinea TaxID=933095 RepID=A0AAI8VHA5_9PEZI|nr:Uu.00g117990.m01.CDS01 [Anthostomella pinea]